MFRQIRVLFLAAVLPAALASCVPSRSPAVIPQQPVDSVRPVAGCPDASELAAADSPPLAAETLPLAAPAPAARVEDLRLELNIPAYRLDVLERGVLIRSYPVAVGTPRFPTPRGSFRIPYIVWNPWWHPPDRAWARDMTPAPPGPDNPMGWVKINFRPLYYVHGTPAEESVGHAASHGCARMKNSDVIELARTIHRVGTPDLPAAELAALERNPRRTRNIRLQRPIVLDIVYRTVEVRLGFLEIYPDVYKLAADLTPDRIRTTLEAAGYPVGYLDGEVLDELTARGARGRVSIDLRDLDAAGRTSGSDSDAPPVEDARSGAREAAGPAPASRRTGSR